MNYRLEELLAIDPADAERFDGGAFATIYLAPYNYHRVHAPLDGAVSAMHFIPGRLFSVNAATARYLPGLFARNERVVSIFDTPAGPLALVLVGAMLVSSMDTVWAGTVTPNDSRRIRTTKYLDDPVILGRGQEMGRFNMGSTVILVLPEQAVDGVQDLVAGCDLRMGQRLGRLNLRAGTRSETVEPS